MSKEPLYIRLSLWNRNDDIRTITLEAKGFDIDTGSWNIGQTVKFKVVGIERADWKGIRSV